MPFYCYLLECADGSYYTGWSIDPVERTKLHNLGRGARYTRMNRPVKLVYTEELADQSSAMKREKAIKRLNHEQKRNLVTKDNQVMSQPIDHQKARPIKQAD